MRAFARDLQIDNSLLSKLLKQKRQFRDELIESLALALDLAPKQIERFKSRRPSAETPDHQAIENKYLKLKQSVFEAVTDNVHYSVLELMKIKGFKNDPKWLAKRLNRSVHEVHAAIDRLKKIGLLAKNEDGTWTDKSHGFSTHIIGPNYTSNAHKAAQLQILEQASKAIKNIPLEKRDQSSMMMAVSSKKLAQAKDMIKKFRRELCEFLENGDEDLDEIYQLSVSLFPLSCAAEAQENPSNKETEDDSAK
jgi:uncharacterized protein (TIGR02147 family)